MIKHIFETNTSENAANFHETQACNFIKKEALAQVFFCEFGEIFKNTFSTKHPRATASGWCNLPKTHLKFHYF